MGLDYLISPQPYFFEGNLFISFLMLFIFSILILYNYLGYNYAIIISFIKTLIPFIFFAFFIDSTWIGLGDDLMYLSNGTLLYDIFSRIFNFELQYLEIDFVYDNYFKSTAPDFNKEVALSNGVFDSLSIFYSYYGYSSFWLKPINWISFFSLILFGYNWYALVIVNIFINILSGLFLYNIALISGFNKNYSKYLLIFFLINVEILSWFSFVALKESLALFLIISIFYAYLSFLNNKINFKIITLFIFSLFILSGVREYLPALLIVYFFLVYVLINYNISYFFNNFNIFLSIGICIAIFIYFFSPNYTTSTKEAFDLNVDIIFNIPFYSFINFHTEFLQMIKSFISYLFGPKPWSINDKYTFLFFASVLHFIFIPITIFGSFNLFREKINFRILLIFFILMGLCYSYVFFENRHRIQFSFIYIWAQYNFLYKIFTTNFFYQKRKIVN